MVKAGIKHPGPKEHGTESTQLNYPKDDVPPPPNIQVKTKHKK